MLIRELLEGYDKEHKCLTPGAMYSIQVKEKSVGVEVTLPKGITIDQSKKKNDDLEADLHYAIEKVLAQFFD
jgi:hypothetical protein